MLKLILIVLSTLFIHRVSNAQLVELITEIQEPVVETSGILRLEGRTITHNDSGGDASLYEIDTITGNTVRTVEILNATNTDWEAICMDEEYIYIGDFGNNNGTRTNLRIYKVLKSDYLDENLTSVSSEIISFYYEDQEDFSSNPLATNFDAEAFISKGDQLYIFTKNWGNNWTNIYSLPKSAGAYEASRLDSLNAEGLVTDATYDHAEDRLMLSGYTLGLVPFYVKVENINDQPFSSADISRQSFSVQNGYSTQIEAICHLTGDYFLMSSEEGIAGTSGLFSLFIGEPDGLLEPNPFNITVYPNPADEVAFVKSDIPLEIELISLDGKFLRKSNTNRVELKGLESGTYILILKTTDSREIKREKLVVR